MAQARTMQMALGAEVGPEELAQTPMPLDRAQNARLRALVEDQFDFAWRSLRRLGVPQSALDDAAQQLFIVVARRLPTIQESHDRSFVFGTAVRIASDYRRLNHRERSRHTPCHAVPLPDPLPAPDELLDQKRARDLLDQVLDRLPMELRSVLILTEGEGLTMLEIASLCDIPPGTAASRLRRAREAFQTELKSLRANRHPPRESP